MNTIQAQSFGGQIISAQLLGREIFYRPAQLQPAPTPARAGVPIAFPQFAANGPLIKHGMARIREWQVFAMLEGCVSTNLLLTEQPDWPHRAQLNMDASIEDDHLEIHLEIRNVGDSAFAWTGGLHPYFLVDDVTQVQIDGWAQSLLLQEQHLNEQAYDTTHPITDALQLHAGAHHLRLEQSGFDHWQVWNAGGAHSLSDIPHADWQRFICVEPVCLTPHLLQPNDTWQGWLKITLTN
ncbi:MAG: hypothetical protein ACRCV6_04645 [Formosimonas sp.]